MVGYNLNEAQKVIDKVLENYKALDKTIVSNWENLKSLLRREWIGYDEEDFEKKFAKRLIDLSTATSAVANSSMETILNLAKAWHEFQSRNTLDGSKISVEPFKLEYQPTTPRASDSISAGGVQINASTTRGLKSGVQSARILHDAVENFINNIRQKSDNLSNSISTERAFTGEQSSAIKNYLKKCGEATAAMATSVKDLEEALATLLGSNYAKSIENVNSEFQSATSNLNGTLSDINSNRWQ